VLGGGGSDGGGGAKTSGTIAVPMLTVVSTASTATPSLAEMVLGGSATKAVAAAATAVAMGE